MECKKDAPLLMVSDGIAWIGVPFEGDSVAISLNYDPKKRAHTYFVEGKMVATVFDEKPRRRGSKQAEIKVPNSDSD